jgi:(p)ppGpp synthase/HD superfamily hydrolase
MSNLERAIEIAFSAHKGQTDKGGNPYILHPLRVMMSLESQAEKMVGVLHDVVEDSDWTFEDLENEGFPVDVIDALKSVTKNESEHGSDEGYFRFVERAKLNPIGARVKIADLQDNLDISRIPELDESSMQRINKYKRSLEILTISQA